MKPQRFFELAEELSGSEAEDRTAINRYYYSVFNSVKTRLKTRGVRFDESAGDHLQVKELINRLDLGGPGPSLESLINTLYQRREDADYRLQAEVDAGDREFAKGEVEQIVDRIGGWE